MPDPQIKPFSPSRIHECVTFTVDGELAMFVPIEIGDPSIMFWKVTLERVEVQKTVEPDA